MDEDSSPSAGSKPNWLERLSQFLLREPENLEELTGMLHSAFERHLLDAAPLAHQLALRARERLDERRRQHREGQAQRREQRLGERAQVDHALPAA